VAADGTVYTTGYFQGTADFDPGGGAFNLTSLGSEDVFLSKLNPPALLTIGDACGTTWTPMVCRIRASRGWQAWPWNCSDRPTPRSAMSTTSPAAKR